MIHDSAQHIQYPPCPAHQIYMNCEVFYEVGGRLGRRLGEKLGGRLGERLSGRPKERGFLYLFNAAVSKNSVINYSTIHLLFDKAILLPVSITLSSCQKVRLESYSTRF